jgi:hypothetical protein
MARKTDGEKIDELEKLAATHAARLDALSQAVKEINLQLSEMGRTVVDLRTEVVLLKRELEELKKW